METVKRLEEAARFAGSWPVLRRLIAKEDILAMCRPQIRASLILIHNKMNDLEQLTSSSLRRELTVNIRKEDGRPVTNDKAITLLER